MKRCEVRSCGKWLLTKDDPRVLCCTDHDFDDLRKGTPKRKQQVNAAAKRARKRAKIEEAEYFKRLHGNEPYKPARRRAKG
jgi:hypothetical protein